jgi:hypothetical protein
VNSYLFPWQMPLILLLIVGWILGGGYFLRLAIRRQYPQTKFKLTRGLLISFLFGGAAAMLGLAIVALFWVIGVEREMPAASTVVAGLIVAVPVAFAAALLTIWSMLDMPFRRAAVAGLLPVGFLFLLTAVIGAACLIPARSIKLAKDDQNACRKNLSDIYMAIDTYERKNGKPPANLKVLVTENYIGNRTLRCPAAKDKEIAFFYLPVKAPDRKSADLIIRGCDFLDNHHDGRNVMFATASQPVWMTEKSFQNLLSKPENLTFAKALQAAEKK